MRATSHSLAAGALLALLATLVACAPRAMPEAAEGRAFFAANCTACHGPGGRGDGPWAGDLARAPVDLTLLARTNGGSFPRQRALAYIYGNPERMDMHRAMPEFATEMDEELVPLEVSGTLTPTPRRLAALLAYLEEIQR
jgi:mono/diheme cytochrome c family protein